MGYKIKKTIYSIQPYEDAKSLVGWIIFIVVVLLLLVGLTIYYMSWYPGTKSIDIFMQIEREAGLVYAIAAEALWLVLCIVLSLIDASLFEKGKEGRRKIWSIRCFIFVTICFWVEVIVLYAAYQVMFWFPCHMNIELFYSAIEGVKGARFTNILWVVFFVISLLLSFIFEMVLFIILDDKFPKMSGWETILVAVPPTVLLCCCLYSLFSYVLYLILL